MLNTDFVISVSTGIDVEIEPLAVSTITIEESKEEKTEQNQEEYKYLIVSEF